MRHATRDSGVPPRFPEPAGRTVRRAGAGLLGIVAAVAFLVGIPLSRVGPAGAGAAPDTLRVVFSSDQLSTLNRTDAMASFKAWIETVGRRRGFNLHVVSETYESEEDLRQRVRKGTADLFILRTLHFVDLGPDRDRLDPQFIPEEGYGARDNYVLLARRDRHLTLPALRGRKLNVRASGGVSLGRTWLLDLVREQRLGAPESFCSGAEDVATASAAILPVYFGKVDACVVEQGGYQVMVDLNPQLGQSLEVCASSPAFLESLVCLRHDFQKNRQELMDGLAELHNEVTGRQLLMVFKINKLLPFEERALDSVRELRARTMLREPGVRTATRGETGMARRTDGQASRGEGLKQ